MTVWFGFFCLLLGLGLLHPGLALTALGLLILLSHESDSSPP